MVNRALLDNVSELSPSQETLAAMPRHKLPQMVTVTFRSGQTGILDTRQPRAAVWIKRLDSLRRHNKPVYVESDPETGTITLLLVPEASRVLELSPVADGDIEVKLIPFQAPHTLRRAHPDFAQLLNALQTARDSRASVLVTRTLRKHEIVDVRNLPDNFEDPFAPRNVPTPPEDDPVSPGRARELFDMMNARSCDPCDANEPCIPFLYTPEGCGARAHEMCRLMLAEGEDPGKVWLYGLLTVHTSNEPDCTHTWYYHVAPTLEVEVSPGNVEIWVLDPSLAPGPETVEEWRARQNTSSAHPVFTDHTPYMPNPDAPVDEDPYYFDPDYVSTVAHLRNKRGDLEEQCSLYGPPPYSCPMSRHCTIITDRSTISEQEVAAMLEESARAGTDPPRAHFEAAFYVQFDGLSPDELGLETLEPPNVVPELHEEVPGMTVTATRASLEYPEYTARRQRITWTCHINFANTDAFTEEVQPVTLSATLSGTTGSAIIRLLTQPVPYQIDGEKSWLSTDIRVFRVIEDQSCFDTVMGSTSEDASHFITDVIDKLNDGSGTSGSESFDGIPEDPQDSWLELAEMVDEKRIFNFALARVRYRSQFMNADNVRVFFRLFPVTSTSVEFDTETYRRGGPPDAAIPLLGVRGGEVATIPCFAAERIDTATESMNDQLDGPNIQTIPLDHSGAERHAYFGCWLDVNQAQEHFPRELPAAEEDWDGPYPEGRRTVQQLINGQHQCLVAEIAFDDAPEPIQLGDTPAMSDRLAQRNLVLVDSTNPGTGASRRIPLTFDIHSTVVTLPPGAIPDELMIDWGDVPRGSEATFYLPGLNVAAVIATADTLYPSHRLRRVDAHTVQCPTDTIAYIPLPAGITTSLACLMTVDLPEGIVYDQIFTVVVRQVTHAEETLIGTDPDSPPPPPVQWRRIVGSFQLTIPVRHKEEMLEPQRRLLSVLRWIQQTIPSDNRWFPVFDRYLGQIAARIDALGGDSNSVRPSRRGEWQDRAIAPCARLAMIAAVLLGILLVFPGVLHGVWLIGGSIAILVLLFAAGYLWITRCHPSPCHLLSVALAGSVSGAVVLVALALLTGPNPLLIAILVLSVVIVGLLIALGRLRSCY